jgi:hypothetical protein
MATTVGAVILRDIKQFAQALKTHLKIPLHEAQTLTASAHSFADWHELCALAETNPFDDRVMAAALSHRSSPALRRPMAISRANEAAVRLAHVAKTTQATAADLNARARGITSMTELAPTMHLDHRSMPAGRGISSVELTNRLSINLFEPRPRFVSIFAAPGFGKSALALSIAAAHARDGGNVCLVSTTIGTQRTVSPMDLVTKLERTILASADGSTQILEPTRELAPFTRITGVGFNPWERPLMPDNCLRQIRAQLRPFSILVIDESESLRSAVGSPFSDSRDDHRAYRDSCRQMAIEIDRILAQGSAIVWLSQLPIDLPLSTATKEILVNIAGRSPLAPGFAFAGGDLSEQAVGLAEGCRHLMIKQEESTYWIAAIAQPGDLPTASLFEARLAEIEALAFTAAQPDPQHSA